MPLALLHVNPAPHPPQFATLVCVLISQPLLSVVSQLPKPALQVLMAQEPVLQVTEAFVRVQLFVPQVLQLLKLAAGPAGFVACSQPLLLLASQLPH